MLKKTLQELLHCYCALLVLIHMLLVHTLKIVGLFVLQYLHKNQTSRREGNNKSGRRYQSGMLASRQCAAIGNLQSLSSSRPSSRACRTAWTRLCTPNLEKIWLT